MFYTGMCVPPAADMRESLEQRVTVSGTTPAIMEQLIDYAYTANITISQENAQVSTTLVVSEPNRPIKLHSQTSSIVIRGEVTPSKDKLIVLCC